MQSPNNQDTGADFKVSSPSNDDKKRKRVRIACQNCQRSHTVCDDGRPCKRCARLGLSDCRDAEKGMSERWHRSRSATLSAAEGSRKRSKSWDFEATTDEELTGFNPAAGYEYAVGIHTGSDEDLEEKEAAATPRVESRRPSWENPTTKATTGSDDSASSTDTPVTSPLPSSSAAQLCVLLDGQYMNLQSLPSQFSSESRLAAVLQVRYLLEHSLRWADSLVNSLQRSQYNLPQPQQQQPQPYFQAFSAYNKAVYAQPAAYPSDMQQVIPSCYRQELYNYYA